MNWEQIETFGKRRREILEDIEVCKKNNLSDLDVLEEELKELDRVWAEMAAEDNENYE